MDESKQQYLHFVEVFEVTSESELRSNADTQITDCQNVDIMTENVDFIITRLTAHRTGYTELG
jgi:hypothetical protein